MNVNWLAALGAAHPEVQDAQMWDYLCESGVFVRCRLQ
jgi:hypothetical protein